MSRRSAGDAGDAARRDSAGLPLSRRRFSARLAKAIGSYALVDALLAHGALGTTVRSVTDPWVRGLHDLAGDLKSGSISPGEWQTRVDTLYRRVDAAELIRAIDLDRLIAGMSYPDRGVATRPVTLPPLASARSGLAFRGKVFGMKRGRAIIPHGHRNMASCHYVLRGDLHLRHYDKIEEDDRNMVIEPTVDRIVGPGTFSSVSDESNNVHWLTARSETAFTFDVIILDLNGGQWHVDNIDPDAAEPSGDGHLRAPKLGVEAALRKYGRVAHRT